MNLQQEINHMVRQAIMEEINNLAIRATIREKIEAAGVSREDIREMVRETADSYFRSAMDGNVEGKIQDIFDQKVSETVDREIRKITGSIRGWSGSDEIRKALDDVARRAIRSGFDVSVKITPKDGA